MVAPVAVNEAKVPLQTVGEFTTVTGIGFTVIVPVEVIFPHPPVNVTV